MDRNNDDVATLEKFALKPTSKLKSGARLDGSFKVAAGDAERFWASSYSFHCCGTVGSTDFTPVKPPAATHDNGYSSGRYGQYELIGNTMQFNGGRLRTMTAYLLTVEGDDEALVVEGCLYLKQPTVR